MQNPPKLQNHNPAFSDTSGEVIVGHLPRVYWWLVLVWLLYGFVLFFTQIQTDEKGITQRCGRRTKFIGWPDVREYEVISSYIVVRSEREIIRFLGMIGAQHQLQKFIETHAAQCQTRAW